MCVRVFVRLFVCMCGLDEVKCERKEETAESVSEWEGSGPALNVDVSQCWFSGCENLMENYQI